MSVRLISTIKYNTREKEKNNSIIRRQIESGICDFRFSAYHIADEETACEFVKDICNWRKEYYNFRFMLDLTAYKSKPRVRLTTSKQLNLLQGDELIIGNKYSISDILVDIDHFGSNISVGNILLIGDGQGAMRVLEVMNGDRLRVRVENDFCLKTRRGIYGLGLKQESTIEKGIEYIIRNSAPDSIVISFVENYDDAISLKELFPVEKTVAKVETISGINNIDEILKANVEIMVGRGDLGMFVGIKNFYKVHNALLEKLSNEGRKFIVATDIFPSLNKRYYPSRADLIDVHNILNYNPSALVITNDLASNNKILEVQRVLREITDEAKN